MISYTNDDASYKTYEERQNFGGKKVKNQPPFCCGEYMACIDSTLPWWNTIEHFQCDQCGCEIVQNDHEIVFNNELLK